MSPPGGVGGCGDAAIAVDGKTAHGSRDADGPAVHLLGPELPSLARPQTRLFLLVSCLQLRVWLAGVHELRTLATRL
jgi:hypothetical protein